MKDFNDLVGKPLNGFLFLWCDFHHVDVGGNHYYAQFRPNKGAWCYFCCESWLSERVSALLPDRSKLVKRSLTLASPTTNQAFVLRTLLKGFESGEAALPIHYISLELLLDSRPNDFRWEPGTPEPPKPFVACAKPPAFTVRPGG